MTELPPELAAFAALLDAQPGPVQGAFQYCLAVAMVEMGKGELIKTEPGETGGAICTFQTAAGDVFNVTRPPLSQEDEAVLVEKLRVILEEEGFL